MLRSRSDLESPTSAIDGEIRPEELTELVERLHRRQERLSVRDVAETLGVEPEAVEATLRAMRSERVPPVAIPLRRARPRRFRKAGLILGAFLVGGTIFAIGHDTGRALRPERLQTRTASVDVGDRLREALPPGVTIQIGNVSYTGRSGTVWADEAELARLLQSAVAKHVNDAPSNIASPMKTVTTVLNVAATAPTLASGLTPKAPEGMAWVPIIVSQGDQTWTRYVPRLTGEVGMPTSFQEAFVKSRSDVADVVANAIAERGESLRRR